MYKLYIGNKNYSSWSLRPWLLLRELGIPFTEQLVPFGNGAFDRFSPTGKVPCLADGEVLLWDSLGITEYVSERHPGVWPTDVAARAWARCAAAEMHSGFNTLRDQCPMSCGIRVSIQNYSAPLRDDIIRLDHLWSEGLRRFGGPYLAGDKFTAVDAFFAPVAFRIQIYDLKMSNAPLSYASQLRALKAMREWYDLAIQEPWRDPGHEEEAKRAGTWLKDFRLSAR